MGYEIDKNLYYQIHDDIDMYFDMFCNVGVDEEKFQHIVDVGYAYMADEFGPGGAYADKLIDNHVFSPTNDKAVAAFALAMSDAGIHLSHGAARRVGRVFDEPPGFSDAERRIYWHELDENQRADVYYGGWNVVWDKLTDSQRKAIEDSWLGDAKRANRRVSVSLEDSLRGILDDIDADGIGSQVRDYVDDRIGLGADLIAASEKYGVDPERLRELRERVSDWYERIYDSYDNVPGYQEAIDAGDALIRSHAPYVDALIEYRGDMLSSDREVAALAFAMDELGLASGGSAYGSRKLVRKALSGGTYNVTYGEGFETHSMRGVDVERVADFLEQEARFLRMNTPGRDYLMTIQIQRVD
jgi:hypothetical protein